MSTTKSYDLIHQKVNNMAEGSDAETEKGNLENDLKRVICQLRMFLMMYDPNKYEVAILVANKDEWIKKVENGQFTVLEV